MYRIMYLSNATVRFLNEELEELLQKARENNSKKDVTGLLIMKGRTFLQCLEGEKQDVMEIFEKIKKDDRHDSIVELIEENNSKRFFPKWWMGYKNINHLDAVSSVKLLDFSDEKISSKLSKDEISQIFKEFIEVS